jgi:hypothetical protein
MPRVEWSGVSRRLALTLITILILPAAARAQANRVGAVDRRIDNLNCGVRGTGSVVNACGDNQIPVSSDPDFKCPTRKCGLGLVVNHEVKPTLYYQAFDVMMGRWRITFCPAATSEWPTWCREFPVADEYPSGPGSRRRPLDKQLKFGELPTPQCSVLVWRSDAQSTPYAVSQRFLLSLDNEDVEQVQGCRQFAR